MHFAGPKGKLLGCFANCFVFLIFLWLLPLYCYWKIKLDAVSYTRFLFSHFSGSTLCVLYLLTPQRPLILGGNDTILLAPYHTFYPQLESHMTQVGLGEARNLWDQPLCIGKCYLYVKLGTLDELSTPRGRQLSSFLSTGFGTHWHIRLSIFASILLMQSARICYFYW